MDDAARTAARAEMLANRLRKNQRRLRSWSRKLGVSCYRLYDRDIPEIPLAVDWYEGRLHVSEYARGEGPEEAEGDDRDGPSAELAALLRAAAEALAVPLDDCFLKERRRQRGKAQYGRVERSDERLAVQEGGLLFWVNLRDYLDTGLFLDHRPTRALVRAEAEGKRVLNLFAYTGSFTVYAAAGGAAHTTSVDLSQRYLDWASDNLVLNGLAGPQHELLRADVLSYLRDAPAASFDLVVLDPPTFSNSKRMQGVLDLQRDQEALLQGAARLLAPGGQIFFSTNFRRFRLEEAALAGLVAHDISDLTVPPDFRDRRIHRCWHILPA